MQAVNARQIHKNQALSVLWDFNTLHILTNFPSAVMIGTGRALLQNPQFQDYVHKYSTEQLSAPASQAQQLEFKAAGATVVTCENIAHDQVFTEHVIPSLQLMILMHLL